MVRVNQNTNKIFNQIVDILLESTIFDLHFSVNEGGDHNLLFFLQLNVDLGLTSQLAKTFFKRQRFGLQSTGIQASQLRIRGTLKEQDNIARNSTADKFDLK